MDKSRLILPLTLLLLGASGCLFLYTQAVATGSEPYFYFRQTVWLILSMTCFFLCRKIPSDWLKRHAPHLAIAGLFFLGSVLLFGATINGMRGWFRYGQFSIQPAEICKPIFIVWIAWLAHRLSPRTTKFVILSFLSLLVCTALIVAEPDLGTSAVYFSTYLGTIFAAGAKKRHIGALLIAGALLGGLLLVTHPYAAKRITGFFDSSQGTHQTTHWHTEQMEISLRRGGWFGIAKERLPGNTTPVPYQVNDSLFAFAAEQMGFCGILPIILLPIFWLAFCLRAAGNTNDTFKSTIFAGAGIMIACQTLLHLAVNTGLLPVTGITMPLISYGGSSLLAMFIIAALCDNR